MKTKMYGLLNQENSVIEAMESNAPINYKISRKEQPKLGNKIKKGPSLYSNTSPDLFFTMAENLI